MTSSAATKDLREMLYAGSSKDVNVVVQTGGSKYWHNYYVDENRSQRWYVSKMRMEELHNEELKNMAQAKTLSDFLIWGINKFKSDKYAVILWNHGGGAIAGFGLDETTEGDTLILEELKNAFEKTKKETGKVFELVAFDACLMSNIETAYVLSPYSKYMAASEGLISEMGFAYDVFINGIKNQENAGGDYLGKILIDSYIYEADKKGSVESHLSVLDLTNTKSVTNKLEKIISGIDVIRNFDKFAQAAYSSAAAGKLISLSEQANMVDIGDFVKNISDDDLSAELEKLVVYKASTKNNKSSLSGVALYFPYSNIEYADYEYTIYKSIGFSDEYTKMLNSYISRLNSDISSRYEPDVKSDWLTTNTKSMLNMNILQGYKQGQETIISCVYPYSANDQNTLNCENYAFSINSVPITVYKRDSNDEFLYTPAVINGQYCEISIAKNSKGYYIKEALAVKKNKNNTIVPLKTFILQPNDKLSVITLTADGKEIKEKKSEPIILSKNTKIKVSKINENKIQLMLKGMEIKSVKN